MEDIGSWIRGSYLVSSQSEFQAKLRDCEDLMTFLVHSNNSDGFGETVQHLAALIQWNPLFEVPEYFIGE